MYDQTDLTIHVNDWDDEGTLYTLTGRGAPLQTYCVLTLRAAVLARLTSVERGRLAETPFRAPEDLCGRVVAAHRYAGECGDPDRTAKGRE